MLFKSTEAIPVNSKLLEIADRILTIYDRDDRDETELIMLHAAFNRENAFLGNPIVSLHELKRVCEDILKL